MEDGSAAVHITCSVVGKGKAVHTIFDAEGRAIAGCEGKNAEVFLESAEVWDVDSPKLYTLMTEVFVGETCTDKLFTRFGIRKAVFDRDAGFFLNGKQRKIQGV